MVHKPITKPGAHGTLYRYAIVYRDNDPACPEFTARLWAYNSEHVLEQFYDAPDGDGWRILRMARMTEAPIHHWIWHS